MVDLSIVLPTCNRAPLLREAIEAIEDTTLCSHEIIVVNGASTDGTENVLAEMSRVLGNGLKVINEPVREGFVKGTNKGFRAATGRCLTWVNDDARPLNNALDRAVEQITAADADVAFVAMFHRWHTTWNVAYETTHQNRNFRLCHVRGTLYANFPVGLRATYEKLGFFDERYFVCAADPDLSLKAWNAGMRVIPACGSIIDHDEFEDDRRAVDDGRAKNDNVKLFAKWDLPERNPLRNDFDPNRPCTLRGMKNQVETIAA